MNPAQNFTMDVTAGLAATRCIIAAMLRCWPREDVSRLEMVISNLRAIDDAELSKIEPRSLEAASTMQGIQDELMAMFLSHLRHE